MEKIEYKGIWWLPSNPDDQVAGILTLIPEKGIELELFGLFLDKHHNFVDKFNSYNDPVLPTQDIILGVANKKLLTLLKCKNKNPSLTVPGIPQENYNISLVISGHHFNKIQDIVFAKITLTFNGLSHWINNQINYQFFPPDFKNQYEIQDFSFKYSRKIEVLAEITQAKISVWDFPEFNFNSQQLNLRSSGYINIEVNQKLSIEECDVQFVQPLCDFLTFATATNNKVKKFWIHIDNHEWLQILSSNMDYQDYNNLLFPVHQMLFRLNDIQNEFSLVMQRWFNLYETIDNVLGLYFALKNNNNLYMEDIFLSLAQAVESYHRKTKRNNILSKEEHDQRIETILDSTPEEYREWLKEKLNFSNELTLKERVEELVNLHWLVMKNVVLDKDKFVRNVKNTRNYYTHFSENLKDKALGGEPLFRLTQKLNFLLQACFLSELGCTPEKCLELISRNGEYTYLQRLVNQEKAN